MQGVSAGAQDYRRGFRFGLAAGGEEDGGREEMETHAYKMAGLA
jgi:hypothetical protein